MCHNGLPPFSDLPHIDQILGLFYLIAYPIGENALELLRQTNVKVCQLDFAPSNNP